jgi:hypothetical protein
MSEKVEELAALDPYSITADGFDDALVGWTNSWTGSNRVVRAVYAVEKVIAILEAEGLSREEAEEHFEFNIAGAYVGEHTPVFVHKFEED